MNNPRDDELIRERIQDLRTEIRGSTRMPDFRSMMDRAREDAAAVPPLQVQPGGAPAWAPSKRRLLWTGGWTSVLAAAAVAGLLLLSGGEDRDAEFDVLVTSFASDASFGAWRSPTSGLLNVPGMELTRSLPSIGETIRGLNPASLPDRPEPEGPSGREEPL